MSLDPPALRLVGVEQTFAARDGSSTTALQDVSLQVDRHRFVAVIGPSGCGKSTILRLAAGLLQPTRGTVEVFGAPVPEPRDDVGIVFQKPTLLPWLSAVDNVVFPIRHKTGSVAAADVERAHALLELVGLKDFHGRRPDELSGGMQQRVAIARALLHDPDILLMDEPFSALDALTRDEMSLELLRIWHEKPKTVIFVTHSIQEALLLSDSIVVMTPRPARVREVIEVPLGRPRGLDALSDPRLSALADEIRRTVFVRAPAGAAR